MYGASTCITLGIPHTPTIAACLIEGMARFHVGTCAFDDIAQHVTIAPDGMIWTGRDWNKIPASVGYGMNVGAFMFEMVGNFDTGHDRLEGEQLESVLTVVIRFSVASGCLLDSLCSIGKCPKPTRPARAAASTSWISSRL